jgi:hypothetical protein
VPKKFFYMLILRTLSATGCGNVRSRQSRSGTCLLASVSPIVALRFGAILAAFLSPTSRAVAAVVVKRPGARREVGGAESTAPHNSLSRESGELSGGALVAGCVNLLISRLFLHF